MSLGYIIVLKFVPCPPLSCFILSNFLNLPVMVMVKSFSRIRLFATPWTVAYQAPLCISCSLSQIWLTVIPQTVACQAPLSMGFSRQEYWNGLPFPSPEDLPNTGIEPGSPTFQANSLPFDPPGKPITVFALHQRNLWSWVILMDDYVFSVN